MCSRGPTFPCPLTKGDTQQSWVEQESLLGRLTQHWLGKGNIFLQIQTNFSGLRFTNLKSNYGCMGQYTGHLKINHDKPTLN